MLKAVFRFDASGNIGAGHAYRCLTLANALDMAGWKCFIAIHPETASFIAHLLTGKHSIMLLGTSPRDEAFEISSQLNGMADLVVIDHYLRFAEYEHSTRLWAGAVMSIDDLPNRKHDCDILLDQTYMRRSVEYKAKVPENCQLLMGTEYALLRPDFEVRRKQAIQRRKKITSINRILINLGMGENAEALQTIIQGVIRSELSAEIRIILPVGARGTERYKDVLEASGTKYRILSNTAEMAQEMASADLAFGAAGISSWERCCLGLPSIVTVLAENQEDICAALSSAGAIINLGPYQVLSVDDVVNACNQLAGEMTAYQSMSQAASALCDGAGTGRCVKAIESFIARKMDTYVSG